jgi:hypothetical protein
MEIIILSDKNQPKKIDNQFKYKTKLSKKCRFVINSIRSISNPNNYLITTQVELTSEFNVEPQKISWNWQQEGDFFTTSKQKSLDMGIVNNGDTIAIIINPNTFVEKLGEFEFHVTYSEIE